VLNSEFLEKIVLDVPDVYMHMESLYKKNKMTNNVLNIDIKYYSYIPAKQKT
jgi:hypothetical protein